MTMQQRALDRYAVMGNPIAHSKSPRIHTLFAEQTGEQLIYEAILVPRDRFSQAVEQFQAEGGQGLNITVPFKQEAWALVQDMSLRARRAGAVNTILFRKDGTVIGDNTDGEGLIRDLQINHGVNLESKRILVLGAGGAARGILGPVLEQRPQQLVLANRTASKAVDLARAFTDLGAVEGCGLTELVGRSFDLILNATAAGISGEVPPLPADLLVTGGWCYDLMYADEPTAFVRWGNEHGARRALDGLGMLVEQAAGSFQLWRGVRPETAPVIAALRRHNH